MDKISVLIELSCRQVFRLSLTWIAECTGCVFSTSLGLHLTMHYCTAHLFVFLNYLIISKQPPRILNLQHPRGVGTWSAQPGGELLKCFNISSWCNIVDTSLWKSISCCSWVFFPTPTDTMEGSLCLLLLAIIFFLQTPKQQDLLCLRSPIQSGCKKDFGGTGGGKNSCCHRQSSLSSCPWLHVLWILPIRFHSPMCLLGTGRHAASLWCFRTTRDTETRWETVRETEVPDGLEEKSF